VDEQKVGEVVEHLQAAALELIAAARVVLDLAEEAVKEPGGVVALVQHLAPPRPTSRPASDRDSRVQRIRVS
jgi:hypothetical protein